MKYDIHTSTLYQLLLRQEYWNAKVCEDLRMSLILLFGSVEDLTDNFNGELLPPSGKQDQTGHAASAASAFCQSVLAGVCWIRGRLSMGTG